MIGVVGSYGTTQTHDHFDSPDILVAVFHMHLTIQSIQEFKEFENTSPSSTSSLFQCYVLETFYKCYWWYWKCQGQ